MCIYIYMCLGACVEVRGQLTAVGFFFYYVSPKN